MTALLVACLCGAAAAQPRYGLAPEPYAVFATWLATSCIGDDGAALRAALLRHRAALAPAFRQAAADGPDAASLRAVRAAAAQRVEAMAALPLAEYRIEGVDRDALARFARNSRTRYVDDEVARYATGYRANAIAGLAIVGTTADRAVLVRWAARRDDPLAPAAAEALRTLTAVPR